MATRTVSNAGGNWNATTTWVGGVVPIAGDDVNFTSTSGNLTVNVSTANLVGINFTNYVGTITFDNPINTNGTVNLGIGGYIQAGANGLVINGTTTLTSGGVTWSRTLTFSGTSITYTLADNWTVTGAISFSGTTASTLNGNILNIGGNLTVTTTAIVSGTTAFVFNGTGTWSHTAAGVIRNNVTINPAGTLTIGTNIYYNTGTLTYTAGTVTTTGSTLFINASTTLNTNTVVWNNITTSGTPTITLTGNLNTTNLTVAATSLSFTLGGNTLNISGTLTINSTATFNTPSNLQVTNLVLGNGVAAAVVLTGAFTISVSGNLTESHGAQTSSGTTSILLNGTGTWSNTGGGGSLQNNLTINTVGTITVSGNVYYSTGTLTYTAGTVTTTGSTLNITGTSTLNVNGVTWNNVTLAGTQTLSSLNIGGNLTTQTTAVVLSGVVNVNVSGNLAINTTTSGTATIILNGTGAQTWSHGSAVYLSNSLTVNKPSGTLTLGANIYYRSGTLTYSAAGAVDSTTNNSTLNIGSSTTLDTSGMSWDNFVCNPADNTTITITLSSNLDIIGNITLCSTFRSTVIFSGGSVTTSNATNILIGQQNYGGLAPNIGGNSVVTFPSSTVLNCNTLTVRAGGTGGSAFNCTINNVTINVNGGLTMQWSNQGTSLFNGSNSLINIIGTGTFSGSGSIGIGLLTIPLTINTIGTVTFSGTINLNSTITYTSGTLTGTTVVMNTCILDLNTGGTWSSPVALVGSTTLLSNANFTNLTTQTSSVTIGGSFDVSVSGNLAINTFTSGRPITLNGTGNQTWSASLNAYLTNNLIINKSAGTLIVSGNVYYQTGILTYSTASSVTTSGSTLNIGASTTLDTNGIIWNNFVCNVNATITLSSDFTWGGTMTLASPTSGSGTITITFSGVGSLSSIPTSTMILGNTIYGSLAGANGGNTTINFPASSVFNISSLTIRCGGTGTPVSTAYNCTINNATFNVSGNLTMTYTNQATSTINGTNSLINMVGSGTISVSGSIGSIQLSLPLTINTTGTLTFSGAINIFNTTITYTSGTLTGVTVIMISCTLDLNAGGVWGTSVALVGNTTLLSNANFSNLTTQTTAVTFTGSFNVNVSGNLAINITTSGASTPIIINGTGAQTWSYGSAVYLSNSLTINKSSGTLTLGANVYYATGTLSYTAGTVDTTTNNNNLIIGGTTTLNTNGINWNNLSTPFGGVITLTSNLDVLNNANFRYSGGTLTFVSSTGTLNVNGNLFLGTSTSVNVDSTITLCNDLTVQSLTITHYSNGQGGLPQVKILNINNFTINVSGNLTTEFFDFGTLNIAGGQITGTTNIVLSGTGTWVANIGPQYNHILVLTLNLTINTLGTITISGTVQYDRGTLTYISGNVITAGSTLFLISISGGVTPITLNTNSLPWNNITIRGGLTITLTGDITINGNFTPTFSTGQPGTTVVNGLFNIIIKGTLQVSNNISGTSTIQLNGVWTTIGYNVFNNLSFNGNSTISGIVYYATGTLKYISGNVITKNSTLFLSTSTLIDCNKINFDKITIASGNIVTMNEFFNGSPKRKTTITPSSTTNYTITFQDGFEKFAKFVKVSRATLSVPGQLTVITDKGNQGNNVGVVFAPNQKANGLPKNTPSVLESTYGTNSLLTDPSLSLL